MFSGEFPWATTAALEIVARKIKGTPIPIPASINLQPSIAALIARCLDRPDKRPSFAEISDILRGFSGLPWLLAPAVHESLRWSKLDTLPVTAAKMELKEAAELATGVRVAELGVAIPSHKQMIDTIKARCGDLGKKATRVFVIDNPRLRAAFQEKISLLKAQLETTFFQAHDFKERERKQVHRQYLVFIRVGLLFFHCPRLCCAVDYRFAQFTASHSSRSWRSNQRRVFCVSRHSAQESNVHRQLWFCCNQPQRWRPWIFRCRSVLHDASFVCGWLCFWRSGNRGMPVALIVFSSMYFCFQVW